MSTQKYEAVVDDDDDQQRRFSVSEEEDDDDEAASTRRTRTSEDLRRHDDETIGAEEEAERLLAGEEKGEGAGGFRGRRERDTRPPRSWRKERWRDDGDGGRGGGGGGGERGELMYKVEEGSRSGRSSVESSPNSSEVDMGRVQAKRQKRKASIFCGRLAAIHVVIIVAFLALLFGAYSASRSLKPATAAKSAISPQVLSNGTHRFAPTTILISLDGFRADFLHRGLTPTLSSFVKQGVSPRYMLPSFPSLTFPNHFTLVTGLHPQDHGVVANTFWDPTMQKEFDRSMDPAFWSAEPLWETAELQGIRTAIHMWPGSEAHIGTKEPAYVDKFNMDEPLDRKVDRILGWLDLPGPNETDASTESPRPQLIAAYVPNVDTDGHAFGPNSTYIRSTISEADGMLGSLFRGLEDRNLTNVVNVVVVSDHGMATTSNDRLIQYEDLIDTSLIEHIDGWPLYGLRPVDQVEKQLQNIYQQLLKKAELPQHSGKFDVYLRDQNMPERYHFSHSDRIAPLWIVPKAGWAIVAKEEFDIAAATARGDIYSPRGLHGYDHEHPLMRAIFVARGPAFPHPPGSIVEPFQNTEVYNIVCDSLGLDPKPNNGTIRLPFNTSALHDPDAEVEIPDDPPPIDTSVPVIGPGSDSSKQLPEGSQILPPSLPGVEKLPPAPEQPETPASPETEPEKPAAGEDDVPDQKQNSSMKSWAEWINAKLQNVKVWATGLFGGSKDDTTPSAEGTGRGDDS
ncbi:Ectonucleotide pyrophosphatase phosphodiesterase family member 6 [Lecanosticta acicola]|uniref:Ectonucleotide pyrophosphatase phosphodiesterase family member 6 n=1 Tax=Lecanosticta acicola TaxID=111012 RepID=A0AAI8YWR1_9PEZI|nr:Ectonucleotide pyrophosphatase phosphodiesterase family member 6 [Lecanosticta acicola]